MTTTESSTGMTETQVRQIPGLASLIERRPPGVVQILRDAQDGEIRAWCSREVDVTEGYSLYGVNGMSSNYTDVRWPTTVQMLVSRRDEMGESGYYRPNRWQELPLLPEPVAPGESVLVAGLRDTIESQTATLASQTTEITRLRREIDTLNTRHERFREQVSRVATRYARENSWCSVVDNALGELGLERIANNFTATVNIRVTFTAERTDGEYNVPSERQVQQALYGEDDIESAISENLGLDEDFAGEINIVSTDFSVLSVRNTNE